MAFGFLVTIVYTQNALKGFQRRNAFVPSAPIDTSLTPLLAMKSSALLTLLILCTLILPLSGFGNLSPTHKQMQLVVKLPDNTFSNSILNSLVTFFSDKHHRLYFPHTTKEDILRKVNGAMFFGYQRSSKYP